MKTRWIALPLLFAAAVLVLFLLSGGLNVNSPLESLNQPALSESVRQTYEPLTIQYQDSQLGFSVRYPVGYPLEAQEGESVAFYAAAPNGLSEVFQWQATQEAATRQDLKLAAAELEADLVSESSIIVDSRKSLRLEYAVPKNQIGESARLVQGWVPCGNYSLYLSALIPDSLAQDKDLADYTLYTARCGPSEKD